MKGNSLDETAEFVRGGAMLPMAPAASRLFADDKEPQCKEDAAAPPTLLGGAGKIPTMIHWSVYLGNASSGSGVLLEDDGRSTAYLSGQYSKITANYSLVDEHTMLLSVQPAYGSYNDLDGVAQPSARPMVFDLHNVLPPATATATTSADQRASSVTTQWDAAGLTASIRVAAFDPALGTSVRVSWDAGNEPRTSLLCGADARADGRPGFVALNARTMAIKKAIDWEAHYGTQPSMMLNRVAMTAIRMERSHSGARAELAAYNQHLAAAVRLHTSGNGSGLPTPRLMRILEAWLKPQPSNATPD